MSAITHNTWFWLFVGATVFSWISSSMPDPDAKSSIGYRWLYGVLHLAGAAIGRVLPLMNARIPWNTMLGGGGDGSGQKAVAQAAPVTSVPPVDGVKP